MISSMIWLVIGVAVAHDDVRLLGDSEVPLACRDLGVVPDDAGIDQRVSARLEMTSCAADARMNALAHLRDSEVSRLALELAVAPTLRTLDDVARSAAPAWRIVAERLRGDLYVAMAVRLQHAAADSGGAAAAVRPWLARACHAYSDARGLAAAHPDALANPFAARALLASARALQCCEAST